MITICCWSLCIIIVLIILFVLAENFYKQEQFSNYKIQSQLFENIDLEDDSNITEKTEYLKTELEDTQLESQILTQYPKSNRCPKCRWVCPPGECAKKCVPLCKKPVCITRCKPLQPARCEIKCEKPNCKNVCPENRECIGGNCPQCRVKCTPPTCRVSCCKPKPECIQQCEAPDCSWDCSRPNNCPPPKCKMICDGDENNDVLQSSQEMIGFNENQF